MRRFTVYKFPKGVNKSGQYIKVGEADTWAGVNWLRQTVKGANAGVSADRQYHTAVYDYDNFVCSP